MLSTSYPPWPFVILDQMHRLPPAKTDTGLDLTEDGCGFANDQHFLTTVNAYFFASELGDTSWK